MIRSCARVMCRRHLAIAFTMVVVLFAVVPSGQASQLLVGNLSLPVDPIHFIGFNNVYIEAIGFTTSSYGATLTVATVEVGAYPGTILFGQLWSSSNGRPGSVFATLSDATVHQFGQGPLDFVTPGVELQPLTSYWLVVGLSLIHI